MKKLSLLKLRIFSTIIMFFLVAVIGAYAFTSQPVVSIVGGESYSPIYNGSRERAEVSLMFNVYEGSDVVLGILDVLDKYDAKSTFFVGGCWADDNGEILVKILEKGHEIGNHGYFHLDHKKLDVSRNEEEILTCHKMVKSLSGVDMVLFAPPSGSFSTNTLTVCEKLGYKTIMWTKDTIDWRDKDENLVFKRATQNVENGDLILMHPKTHTLKSLDKILQKYKELGIKAVTVSQCIKTDDL